MKRSSRVGLSLMGSLPLLLSACSAEQEQHNVPTAYDTLSSCMADGNPQARCADALRLAQNDAVQNAPRFTTGRDCEMSFDKCTEVPAAPAVAATSGTGNEATVSAAAGEPAQAGGSSFIPVMAGFMLGNALANNSALSNGSALYRDRGGQLAQASRAANGQTVARPVSGVRSVNRASIAARSTGRGGFGGRSGGYGG